MMNHYRDLAVAYMAYFLRRTEHFSLLLNYNQTNETIVRGSVNHKEHYYAVRHEVCAHRTANLSIGNLDVPNLSSMQEELCDLPC